MVTRSVKLYDYEIYAVDIVTKTNTTITFTSVKHYKDEAKLFKAVYEIMPLDENIRLVTLLKTKISTKRYGLTLDKFLEQAQLIGEKESYNDKDNKEENE